MSEQDARARVESFIADFHAAWTRAGRMPMPSFGASGVGADPQAWFAAVQDLDFEAWGREKQVLADRHFVPGSTYAANTSLSGKPAHDPSRERVVRVEVRRTRGDVETELSDGAHTTHHVFRLARVGDEWRIDRVVETSGPAASPLVPADKVEALLGAIDDGRLEAAVPDERAQGISRLFSDERAVVGLGSITTSGMLTVHDLGWAKLDLAPFHRRVPAGTHPVEVSRDDTGTNLALRIRFSSAPVATRVAAERVGTGSDVSVDAGNVAVLDFTGVAATPEVQVEEAFQRSVEQGAPDTLLTLGSGLGTGAPDCAVVTSGYGDGGYPIWWGLAEDGTVVDLVVDFLVAVEDVTTVVRVPYAVGPVEHEDLVARGFEVLAPGDRVLFRHRVAAGSTYVRDVRVLDAPGRPWPGRDGGTFDQGGWSEQEWQPQHPVGDDAVLEVTLWQGYRHV